MLKAYDERCAITGLKLINVLRDAPSPGSSPGSVSPQDEQRAAGGGGGGAYPPVEANGPDTIQNGLALSGTMHWMFDRGLIGLSDDLDILVSRQVNDPDGVRGLINKSGKALPPLRPGDRPHPHFWGGIGNRCSNTERPSRE